MDGSLQSIGSLSLTGFIFSLFPFFSFFSYHLHIMVGSSYCTSYRACSLEYLIILFARYLWQVNPSGNNSTSISLTPCCSVRLFLVVNSETFGPIGSCLVPICLQQAALFSGPLNGSIAAEDRPPCDWGCSPSPRCASFSISPLRLLFCLSLLPDADRLGGLSGFSALILLSSALLLPLPFLSFPFLFSQAVTSRSSSPHVHFISSQIHLSVTSPPPLSP